MDFLIIHQRPYRAVVPHLFGTRDQFCGRQSWTRGWGGGFRMTQVYYIYVHSISLTITSA